MDAAAARRARDAIALVGQFVSVRRMSTDARPTVVARADVAAIVLGYRPEELVAGITSGSRRVVVSLLDLTAAGFPLPLKKGDRIYLGSAFETPTTITAIDPGHREYSGCLDISVSGA